MLLAWVNFDENDTPNGSVYYKWLILTHIISQTPFIYILQHKLMHNVMLYTTVTVLWLQKHRSYFRSSSEAWAEVTDLSHHPVLQNSSWQKQMVTAQIV